MPLTHIETIFLQSEQQIVNEHELAINNKL